jgi:hypothetical protein
MQIIPQTNGNGYKIAQINEGRKKRRRVNYCNSSTLMNIPMDIVD